MFRSSVRLLQVFCVGLFMSQVPVLAACAKTVDQSYPVSRASGPSADTYKQLTLFADVLERTRADYVDEVTDEKLIENAINGMLSSLDPHSGFLNKKSFEDMAEKYKKWLGTQKIT